MAIIKRACARRGSRLTLFILTVAGALAQPPEIGLVANAASYALPGLPNAGIAQGGAFVVAGLNLGPEEIVIASQLPVQTSLAGTSIEVTVSGQTVHPLVLYTWMFQVAAVLPSATPVGSGTVVIRYNGAASPPAPITVVRNNVAMYTLNQNGSGAAIVTLPDYSLVTAENAANPGEVVTLWATGLGPVPYDEARLALGGDMLDVPLEAFVGGRPARILYRGRNSCCIALDQINVEIPNGVSGCLTSVILKIGLLVSRVNTIPIAERGRACVANRPTIPPEDVARLRGQETFSFGQIGLARQTGSLRSGSVVTTLRADGGLGLLARWPTGVLTRLSAGIPSQGSCIAPVPQDFGDTTPIDAGPAFTVSGPGGSRLIPRLFPGSYASDLGAGYLVPGSYTIGGGSVDVGEFTVQATVPTHLDWINRTSLARIRRDVGATLRWTGGDPEGYINIQVIANNGIAGGGFTCSAQVSDREFTMPAALLLSLPADAEGTLSIQAYSHKRIQIPRLDVAYFQYMDVIVQPIAFE